jgi:hypothetical protein
MEALRALLQNEKIVGKHFAFALIEKGDWENLISEATSIPSNMTILSNHFKISYQGNRNPFEKQKVWSLNKKDKDKEEFREPMIIF